ncbi:hypothetical protein [Janthinobacterium agaricidamnosum]|uniref:hypothetical protein n=1 Tax=Janthinobacterium agaricidamnosum TaxID=55508 RepID=UPI0011849E14|nr:hypothetical protein [Janthinobacterium agaricidamnosum]
MAVDKELGGLLKTCKVGQFIYLQSFFNVNFESPLCIETLTGASGRQSFSIELPDACPARPRRRSQPEKIRRVAALVQRFCQDERRHSSDFPIIGLQA